MGKPAPYPPTDSEEDEAVTVFRYLINKRLIKADLKTRDKVPNYDGTLELVNHEQVPLGKLDVQIRKINRARGRKCPCETTLIAYSERTTLPFIFVGVDTVEKKAYWKQIKRSMPEFKEGQKSFTIAFDAIADSIDEREVYIGRWAEIVLDYQERVSNYPTVKELADTLAPSSIEPEYRALLQRFIDKVNGLLDHHFVAVKNLLFPDAWKLGVGVGSFTEREALYQIYKIPYWDTTPLVCKLNRRFLSENVEVSLSSEQGTPTQLFSDPEGVGQKWVLNRVKDVVENRMLPIQGELLAADILFAFVDRYYKDLNLPPQQDHYRVDELNYSLYEYWFSPYTMANPQIPISFSLGLGAVSMRAVLESIQYLLANEIEIVSRTFARRTLAPTTGGYWIWEGYTQEDEVNSITFVLNNSIKEYLTFVKGNQLHLPNSLYSDPSVSIIYEYKPTYLYESGVGPGFRVHYVENPQLQLPKLAVYVLDQPLGLDNQQFPMLTIQGRTYKALVTSDNSASFLFHRTPVFNMIYWMLRHDLEHCYGLRHIGDRHV